MITWVLLSRAYQRKRERALGSNAANVEEGKVLHWWCVGGLPLKLRDHTDQIRSRGGLLHYTMLTLVSTSFSQAKKDYIFSNT